MRTTTVVRFVLFGAVGFGVGWSIFGTIPVGDAVGGASLGLALNWKDARRVIILALLGGLGGTLAVVVVGINVVVFAGPLIWDYPWKMAALSGTMVGASLGIGFADWKRVVALAATGSVGFGIGGGIAGDSQSWFLVAGLIGGASLGAVLGYLEERKLAEQRRTRVR
jgi:hypothetical protein